MPNLISEDQIEKAIIQKLTANLGYRHVNCYTQDPENLNDRSGRTNKNEVILFDILKYKVKALNSDISEGVIDEALIHLTNKRYAMSLVLANKEVYSLIRDGIPVEYQNAEGRTEHGRIKIIDFHNIPEFQSYQTSRQ